MPHKWKVFDRLVIFLPCQPLSGRGRDHMMVGQRKRSKNIYLRKTTGKEKKNRQILSTKLILFSFYASKEINVIREGQNCYYNAHINNFCLVKIHWKLGQQTPSVRIFLAYLETTAYTMLFKNKTFFCFKIETWNF